MDKQGKLERYSRKDYSDNVHFPVEIIGRDGVVRQYSFDDSIRLYQRRVTFAAIRYRDKDLVSAELFHCRSRIEQLRRSYFHWFGWGTVEGEESPQAVFGDLSGEVAAFVRRVLACANRVDATFTCMETNDERSMWYLQSIRMPGMLLYFYDLRSDDAEALREEFFSRLKDLEGSGRLGADMERLVAFHHGGDCALSVTVRGEDYDEVVSASQSLRPGTEASTPIGETMRLLRARKYEAALSLCRERLNEFPWHKQAYYLGSSIALHLRKRAEAEEIAVLGTRFFQDDPEMLYRLGRVRLNDGRLEEGLADLRAALAQSTRHRGAVVLLVVALLRSGKLSAASDVLAEADIEDRELVTLGQWIQWRRLFGILALSLFGVGSFAVWTAGAVGLLLTGTAFALLGMGWFAFSRFLDDLWKRELWEDPLQAKFSFSKEKRSESVS
jgi:hypothetical protein